MKLSCGVTSMIAPLKSVKTVLTAYLFSEFTHQNAFWNHEASGCAWCSREMRSRAP